MLYAWTAPSAGVVPPAQNTPAPITISDSNQNKLGALGLGGLAVFGKTLLTETNNYALPSIKPSMLLGVNGAIGAKEYCDEKGMNCVTTLGGSISNGGSVGAGGWVNVPLNDASMFDKNCEYRFISTQPNAYKGTNSITYATQVSPESLVYILHDSLVSHVNSSSKTIYRLNGADTSWKITKMEKKCGEVASGNSSAQIIAGWPNKILCDAGNQKAVLYIDGLSGEGYPENRVRYSSFQDTGPHTSLHFNYNNGNYISLVGRTDAFGKAIDACVAKGNIKNQAAFN